MLRFSFLLLLFIYFILFLRKREGRRGREWRRQSRGSKVGSPLTADSPTQGSNSRTIHSRSEPKSRVWCLIYRATFPLVTVLKCNFHVCALPGSSLRDLKLLFWFKAWAQDPELDDLPINISLSTVIGAGVATWHELVQWASVLGLLLDLMERRGSPCMGRCEPALQWGYINSMLFWLL